MKIVMIKARGQNEKNRNFSEAECFKRALQRLKIDSILWGPGYPDFEEPLDNRAGREDAILLLENYEEGGWIPDISKQKALKLFWSIDSHCALNAHLSLCKRLKINVVLNSTSSYVSHFKAWGRKCFWFPNACPADIVYPLAIPKTHDVGFCGNYCNRKEDIDFLSERHHLKTDIFVLGNDMVRAINSYKIHWNKNIANDINFRTFETLGCKTFLVTNETDRLGDLFDIGKHLVVYNGMKDCSEKINYYLTHETEREQIAEAGYRHTSSNHTYDIRTGQLLEILKKAM